MIGKAGLFYNQDTGIKRFNRDISSLRLRWTLHLEGESGFNYIQDAYIFKDNLSLCHDAMISSERGVFAEFTLKEINQNERIFVNEKGSSFQSSVQTGMDISRLSAILAAAQKVTTGAFNSKEMFQYLSATENENILKIVYVAEMWEEIAHKNIPTSIISITQQNEEIHRFKFFKDDNGYCYPVAIYFNIDDALQCLELILEKFPGTQSLQNPDQTSVVYLDFMEANSRSLKNQTAIAKLVRGPIYNQIKKELNAAIIGSGKQLVLDMQTGSKLNTASKIKELIDIIFEQDVSIKEKINKITGRLNIPAKVDIIVTGQYVDNPDAASIMIRPMVILKNNPSIKTSNLMFSQAQLFCREPGTGKQVPCQDSENYIAREVRQFILPALKFNRDNQGFTIEDVYRMILENRYFCHSQDYGYHSEVLEHLKESERIDKQNSVRVAQLGSGEASRYSYTFESGWEVRTAIEMNTKIVKTTSANKSDYSKVTPIYWDIVEGRETTYDKAQQMIEALNSSNNEGHADWRLPTLEEVLFITSDKSTNPFFLPFALPSEKVNMIWTATPLAENEKMRLTEDETDAYFVLKRAHDRRGEKVQFDTLEKDQVAFFLPVRSPISAAHQSSQPGHKGLSIANLAFMKTADRSPLVSSDLGQAMDQTVNNGMNMVVAFNNAFTIIDGNQPSFSTASNANLLANIFFNPNLANEKKVREIIEGLMKPYKIDLLVTGIYFDDSSSGMVTVRPMVIYKYNQVIKTGNLQFRRTEFECWDNRSRQKIICPRAAEQIAKAVKELLERS